MNLLRNQKLMIWLLNAVIDDSIIFGKPTGTLQDSLASPMLLDTER